MARLVGLFAFVALLLSAAGYLYFAGKEYEIRIPEAEIQARLSEKLPLTKTYFFVFQLTLEEPRVHLLEESGRIGAGLDLTLNVKVGGEGKPLDGSVDASGRLQYDSGEGQFYLAEPVIEQLSIQGLPGKYADRAKKVIELALTEYYATHPIYKLKAGDTKQAAAKLVLKNVSVSGDELVVVLGI
ncbi:DUF1439 domain-containing protein [Microbulbifer taiwanensis]|uniref:DUF1439 domain-containing protein n=1 Tax=Microbulbifer taiwanensis TaxID=986746 RepID=A0ABW1YKY0_9GAMM|nr:DUF1439 domain-containing protein [Microbulbifer taiwanensis]